MSKFLVMGLPSHVIPLKLDEPGIIRQNVQCKGVIEIDNYLYLAHLCKIQKEYSSKSKHSFN